MTGGDFVLSGGGRPCGNSERLDIRRVAGGEELEGFLRGAARLWPRRCRREGRVVSKGLRVAAVASLLSASTRSKFDIKRRRTEGFLRSGLGCG